mgnify:CR=1 FL=1
MKARANTKIFLIYQTFTRLFLFKITLLKMYVCSMKIAYTINLSYKQIILLFIYIINKQTSKGKNQVHPIILNAPHHIKHRELPHHIKHNPSY